MSRKKFLLFLINIVNLKLGFSMSNPNELDMIVDVLLSYDKPTVVAAKVCWKPSDKIKFATVVYNMERPSNIRYLRKHETVDRLQDSNHILFLIDMNCPDIRYFLNKADTNKMFNKSYRWLLIVKSTEYSNNVPIELEDLSVSVDSEVVITQELPNKDFKLHAVYKVKPHSAWNIEYYGSWSKSQGLKKSEDTFISNVMRRKDFKGETITTSTVITNNSTKTDLLGLRDITVDTVTKFSMRNVNRLYDFLNASRRIIFTNTWGYYRNGSWNGMIRDLTQKEADLCGTVSFMQLERMRALEYLIEPTHITTKFVFRQPPLSYQNNLFILPFTTSVWYCLAGFIVILTVILYVNTKWDMKKYEEYDEKSNDHTCLIPRWSDITMFMLSAVSQQGSSNELKGTLGRLVMFLIFLSFLFLYTSYSANIIALLQSSSNQIQTLTDLLNSKLELGVENTPYNRYYFSEEYVRTQDPIRKAIYFRKVASKGKANILDLEQGVKRMQTKPFAFHMHLGNGYRTVLALFQEHEKCGLQEIQFLPDTKVWQCSAKFSPFSEMFKVGYIRIQEHGLSDRESRLIHAKKPACSSSGASFVSVNMVDFYPVLLLLLYGMILAVVLLSLEIIVNRKLKLDK